MKKNKIEKLLRQESKKVFQDVSSVVKKAHFGHTKQPKRNQWKLVALFTPLVLAASLLIAFVIIPFTQPLTYLTFAINPEIQLTFNNQEKIQAIEGLNPDGAILLYDEDFKGLSLNQGINKLMELYAAYGFLETEPTIRLLSYNRFTSQEQKMLQKSAQYVQNYLDTSGYHATIQNINEEQSALSILKTELLEMGYNQAQLRNKSASQMFKMRANYQENQMIFLLNEMRTFKNSIANLSPSQRKSAITNMKKNKFGNS